MKKMILGVSMILACLIFLASPATAASQPQGAPGLGAFLASLAPAPVTVAKRPAIAGKSICSASATCWDGNTVSCNGNSSCTTVDGDCSVDEPGHVTCDGATTPCPNACPCPAGFCDNRESDCSISCNPCSYNFSCNATTCSSSCRCILRGCPQ
ncbi:MAG TPA: hypothetical protein VGP73_25460 [Thermoanaerobaculia bacterium]